MSDEWIAVDWGTTQLRAWVIAADGTLRHRLASDAGMGSLEPDAFEPALQALLDDAGVRRGNRQVIACGMVGARQGWFEAPYRETPCEPTATGALVRIPHTSAGLQVELVPGLAQRLPADVMRGEETQIAGLLVARPAFTGTLCLPGTHTKWVRIEAGQVASFSTAMTGELFALLRERSVLRHSVKPLAGDDPSLPEPDWNDAAFDDAVSMSLSEPERLCHRLFSLRAGHLLDGLDAGAARSRLSGWLLGLEIAGLTRHVAGSDSGRTDPATTPRPASAGDSSRPSVVVIGAPALAARYRRALQAAGISAELVDGDPLVLAGLAALRVPNNPEQERS